MTNTTSSPARWRATKYDAAPNDTEPCRDTRRVAPAGIAPAGSAWSGSRLGESAVIVRSSKRRIGGTFPID